ncbi:kinase-like domain-containing protein [Podospora appendiculata]|uniref:Kinase-like domain-containing protein n=1 Tax=Podospora appendiculata TaxID=314037 RepID=A0AAE1CHK0_9PEZI|nr:kinase-like domain-containing protein [Podospora appendiculata]
MSAPSPSPLVSGQPIRSAMKSESDHDRTPPTHGSSKAVQIAEPEPEPAPVEESPAKKQFPANIARRLSGRPAVPASPSKASLNSIDSPKLLATAASASSMTNDSPQPQPAHRHKPDRDSVRLVTQVAEWLQRELTKRETKKSLKLSRRRKPSPLLKTESGSVPGPGLERTISNESTSSEKSLDRLKRIVDDSMAAMGLNADPHASPHLGRRPHHRKSPKSISLTRTMSSDTEFYDGDVVVPSCDGFLDNSKTLSYTGGKSAVDDAVSSSSRREEKEKQAWITFKNEIIRLAHTLKLKGWRRVPLNSGESISVERLSGALTNAVYVVSPPPESALSPGGEGKKTPTKVLLRIYGPQVEHLIDREKELSVLRRLARKKIGPRLLGTFLNGRFEQFFNATTLTPANLREPETSKQIAKRMRELHDGVELLEEEKNEGPAVWRNWDRWLEQAEKTVTFLDQVVLSGPRGAMRGPKDAWKMRGPVCGVEWPQFKALVQKYRDFLDSYYGNAKKIREKLVFAHNDTQYGNILRIRPDDQKSPLLQPANEHKQLIVIDFEYAAANVPGYEFANHFSEWTYNYHDPVTPFACETDKYPAPEQQERFIKAYVNHRSKYATPSSTPAFHSTSSASSIVEFMLDARIPPGSWKDEEVHREEEIEKRVLELMEETRIWRTANSAQWVMWGIVQAKIPDLRLPTDKPEGSAEEESVPEEEEADTDDVFDYLGYAQERALFFLGDCVLMGLAKAEELPAEVRSKLKLVSH